MTLHAKEIDQVPIQIPVLELRTSTRDLLPSLTCPSQELCADHKILDYLSTWKVFSEKKGDERGLYII